MTNPTEITMSDIERLKAAYKAYDEAITHVMSSQYQLLEEKIEKSPVAQDGYAARDKLQNARARFESILVHL